jgi:hypothetical protein
MLPSFAPESEADADLGIQLLMTPQGEYDPFTVTADAGYTFTDNARLTRTNQQGDHMFIGGASISWLPILSGNLYGEATAGAETFRYASMTDLDFDVFDLGAGLVYVIRQLGDLSVYVRYNYEEFADLGSGFDDAYRSHALQTGAYKSWILSRNHYAYVSWLSDINLGGEPGYSVLDDHSLTVGYRITPMAKLKTEVFFRSAFLDYDERNREDWNSAAGLSASWNFTPNLYVSANAAFTDNRSNEPGDADYQVWQTGIRLGGYWQF